MRMGGARRSFLKCRGAGDAEYRAAFDGRIVPKLDEYCPEFLLVSAEFDALSADMISHMWPEPESYGWMAKRLVQAAERHAQGRIVSVLEGGYALDHLGRAAAAHVVGLAD
ncbi:MAG: hypothetical protein JXM70_04340 [Pirellulales bacterium]|nr:hypothetical protein [Pirellulales bacterium]